ncbi:MAG: hypothetical protein RR565_04205 [Erysipelothrix sp.]
MIGHARKYCFKRFTFKIIVGVTFLYTFVSAIERRVFISSLDADVLVKAKYLSYSFYEARLTMVLFPVFLLLLVERINFYRASEVNAKVRLNERYYVDLMKSELMWSVPFIILTVLNLWIHYPFKFSATVAVMLLIELAKFLVLPFIVFKRNLVHAKETIYGFIVVYYIYVYLAFQVI